MMALINILSDIDITSYMMLVLIALIAFLNFEVRELYNKINYTEKMLKNQEYKNEILEDYLKDFKKWIKEK